MNKEEAKMYFKSIEDLYDLINYIFDGLDRNIICNKIEELELLSKYLLGGEDNE